MQTLPLAGVRVLSLDNYEAGNYGTALLAMHGADVVKVEVPGRGDVLRSAGPFMRDEPHFSHGEIRLMRGKRSVALDLNSDEGRRTLESFVKAADVLWTNLRPNSRKKLGIDWPTVHALNERLVYASITGFGLPSAAEPTPPDTPAFDIIVQALAGLLQRNASPDGVPEYNGIPLADQAASLYGSWGVLAALLHRERTGEGVCVDVAMYDSAIAFNEKALTVYGMTGELPRSRSSATSAPFGVFPTSDGFIVIGVGGNPVWERFCDAIDRSDLKQDEALKDGASRVAESDRVRRIVEAWSLALTSAAAVETLLRADVPAAPVMGLEDILRSDRARLRGIVSTLDAATRSESVVTSPVRFVDGGGQAVVLPPPRLGADRVGVVEDWAGEPVGSSPTGAA